MEKTASNVLETFDDRFEMTTSNLFELHEPQTLNTGGELDSVSKLPSYPSGSDDAFCKRYVVNGSTSVGTALEGEAISAGRARCGLCQKLFKGPEFVVKHLRPKHPEKIIDLAQTNQMRRLYFYNCSVFKTIILSTPQKQVYTGLYSSLPR